MAYPFTPMPSLGDFIESLLSNKYRVHIETIEMSGPRGKVGIEALVRKGKKGKKKLAVIPDFKKDDILTPHVLRSLCVQLDIPPKDCGLHLN